MKSQSGFSLVEILMCLGMLGTLSMGVMHLVKNQTDAAKVAESRASELDFLNQVRQTLLNKLSCEETFIGLSFGDTIESIKNSEGTSVYKINEPYINRNIQVKQMRLENSTVPSGGGSGTARIIFELERLGVGNSAVKELEKELMVMVETNSADEVLTCYTDLDGLVQTSKIEVCESLDGLFNVEEDKCELITKGVAIGGELTSEMQNPPACNSSPAKLSLTIHQNSFKLVATFPPTPGCLGGPVYETYYVDSWSGCTITDKIPNTCPVN